jgi:hypothetical protein
MPWLPARAKGEMYARVTRRTAIMERRMRSDGVQLMQSQLIGHVPNGARAQTSHALGSYDSTLTAPGLLHRLHSGSSKLHVSSLDAGKGLSVPGERARTSQLGFTDIHSARQVDSSDAGDADIGDAPVSASDDRDRSRAGRSEHSTVGMNTIATSARSFSLALRTWTSRWPQSAVVHKHLQRMLSAEQQVSFLL